MTQSEKTTRTESSDGAGSWPAGALLHITNPSEKRVVHNPEGRLPADVARREDLCLIRSCKTKEPDVGITKGRDILSFEPAVFVINQDRNRSTLEVVILVASAFVYEALKCYPGVECLWWEFLQLDLN